ncbi:alpha/beta hydrolase [Streptomyces albofaciens JCM 4342]|uniref:alpha/beta fold hydrolase n=1 Tax=Streptomyces albofaciens TaxID=66866 RepID=UPI0012384B44|nr:alpha/beta hydrolase [Streptomyces albofaciens]KAA6222930.1 alpha/beta hydrolase [Streptomyces albofaciens JCM 4342]
MTTSDEMTTSATSATSDETLVLIHGAQHGGWCWRKVLGPLRGLGHDVHAITLTGLGERAHLLTPDVDLNTHIADVLAMIEAEELSGVTLVGHSYGGMVAAGVTARLRHPAVRRLVYLDSPVPVDGDSVSAVHPQVHRLARAHTVVDGVAVLPVGEATAMGVRGGDAAWVQRRLTPHPYGTVRTPLRLPDGWNDGVEQVYIRCVSGADGRARSHLDTSRVDEAAGWRYFELESGHDAMIDAPDGLVALLKEVCATGQTTV